MSEPFIAQITMFAGNFAPRSWAFCSGQILRYHRTRRCSHLLVPRTGVTGERHLDCPTFAVEFRVVPKVILRARD